MLPVITLGVAGVLFTVKERTDELAQLFTAVTVMAPVVKLLAKLTVMLRSFAVPTPPGCEVMVAPAGTAQIYEVALACEAIE